MVEPRIAVLIPCFNEAASIGAVIDDFTRTLPAAQCYVYDNNSTDDTAAIAAARGAIVREEARQGKGNVIRRMFADIEADAFVLVEARRSHNSNGFCGYLVHVTSGHRDYGGSPKASQIASLCDSTGTSCPTYRFHSFTMPILAGLTLFWSRRTTPMYTCTTIRVRCL